MWWAWADTSSMVTTGSVKQVGPMEAVKPGTVKFCNQGVGSYKLK